MRYLRIKSASFFWAAIIIAGASFITSCTNDKEGNNTIDVLSLKGPSAMSMLFMMDSLEELNGKQLEYTIFDEPVQLRARLLKDEPEFALLPTNMAANLYNKGVPYQVCAIPVWGTLMVLGDSNDVKSWQDLNGKRINLMGKGMTPDILFRFLADKNGLDPDKDLELDYSFPTHSDLANAVIAGLSDIAVLSEPLVSMVRSKNKSIQLIFDLDQEWKKVFKDDSSIPQTSLLVKKQFADNNQGFVINLISKYGEYCSMVNKRIDDAARAAVKFNVMPDAGTAAASIPGCNMKVVPSWEARDRIGSFLEVFYKFDPITIGGKLPDEDFFFKK